MMRVGSTTRLRLILAVFVAGVAIPAWLLFSHALGQLKWEAFYDARQSALAVARSIDRQLATLVARELQRAPDQYGFSAATELARLPGELDSVPGLVGHFQVGADGRLTAPVLPTTEAGRRQVSGDLAKRQAVRDSIERVLTQNLLIDAAAGSGNRDYGEAVSAGSSAARRSSSYPASTDSDAEEVESPPAASRRPIESAQNSRFDDLSSPSRQRLAVSKQEAYGRLEDIELDSRLDEALNQAEAVPATIAATELTGGARPLAAAPEEKEVRARALDQDGLRPDAEPSGDLLPELAQDVRVTAFAQAADGFRFSLLDSGHFVLFRNVWQDEKRQVQGLLFDRQPFLDAVAGQQLAAVAPDLPAQMLVAYGGSVLASYSGAGHDTRTYSELSGELLYQTRLSPPLSALELVFVAGNLPLGSSVNLLLWLAGAIALVLLAGSALIYRLGIQQLRLARQQRDFVSAVSHELKTPLTSIRMYGEMLAGGLAREERKPEYYRFIFDETERLSRLIENVLQLARLDRDELALDPVEITVGELFDQVQSRVGSQADAAGFELVVDAGSEATRMVRVDVDAMLQVFINLVDNAIKFSRDAESRRIQIGARCDGRRLALTVRDHGPGIAADQLGKIFGLFYRSENELTRETVGTGIGLALVRQLVAGMGGRVEVHNCDPGAEFQIILDHA